MSLAMALARLRHPCWQRSVSRAVSRVNHLSHRTDRPHVFMSMHACTHSHRRVCVCQALRPGVHGGKAGSFRASFEDKPLLSDIVFLRAWIAVDLPRFYNPVTNLLAPALAPSPPKPSDTQVSRLLLLYLAALGLVQTGRENTAGKWHKCMQCGNISESRMVSSICTCCALSRLVSSGSHGPCCS